MGWFRKPVQQKDEPESSDTEAHLGAKVDTPSPATRPDPEPTPGPPRPSQDIEAVLRHFKTPTKKLSAHQIFYIFALDGLGAMMLSGGINFAVAYAMYATQDTGAHPIRLFQLPNTLAGDAAVTIIIQSLMTWMIEYGLVNRDLRTGGVSPIGFLPRPKHPLLRRLFFLDEYASGADVRHHRLLFLAEQAARAMLTAVVGFVLLWPAGVAVLTAVGMRSGGDWAFERLWVPQLFKLVLGGVLGLLQTPAYASFWLVREGWVLLAQEEGSGNEGGDGKVDGPL